MYCEVDKMTATGIPPSVTIGLEIRSLKSVIEEQKAAFREFKELFLTKSDEGRLQTFEVSITANLTKQLREQSTSFTEQFSDLKALFLANSSSSSSAASASLPISHSSTNPLSSASLVPASSLVAPATSSNIISVSDLYGANKREQQLWATQRQLVSWDDHLHYIPSALLLEGIMCVDIYVFILCYCFYMCICVYDYVFIMIFAI